MQDLLSPNNQKLLKIAQELYEFYCAEKEKLPYRINIIKELRDTENAHSRILRGLLNYCKSNTFTVLISFLELLQRKCKSLNIAVCKPVLTVEKNRIDILIKEQKSYAIIIENKIWNAEDQSKQIQRYVEIVKGVGIPLNKIFVVYLTKDGSKKISDVSLTVEARKYLGLSSKNNGRFIAIDFKNDILPWLQTLSEYENVKNEPLLYSAIVQYIDYLKGEFNLRDEDRIIETQLNKMIMERLNLNNLGGLLSSWDEIDKLRSCVWNSINEKIAELCENKICKILRNKGYEIRNSWFNYSEFNIGIVVSEWKKCIWYFTDDNSRLYSGIYLEDGATVSKKDQKIVRELYEAEPENGYIGWDWWNGDTRVNNDDFWIYVEEHSTKFTNDIIREIERVREGTKNCKL